MLISLCTPVMNRTSDLKRTMDARIEAARRSTPVEFVILDYGSHDGLQNYIYDYCVVMPDGITVFYQRYGADNYHQAHAWNLAALMSHGDYICIMGADTYPRPGYFEAVRELAEQGCVWMEDKRYRGAICVKRDEFIAAGGYDERFEFYGPEDRALADRLTRRECKKGILPPGLIGSHFTPDTVKVANYRIQRTKHQHSAEMRKIYEQNKRDGALVANVEGWGKWT